MYPYEVKGDRLWVAIRALQEGDRVLGLGKLNRHTAGQRKAIKDLLDLCLKKGLSYGHFTVIDIMDEKFHEIKDETKWHPKYPFYYALKEEKRYWPNVLGVLKKPGMIRLVTLWAYCGEEFGWDQLWGNSYRVILSDPQKRFLSNFIRYECCENGSSELTNMVLDVENEVHETGQTYDQVLWTYLGWD